MEKRKRKIKTIKTCINIMIIGLIIYGISAMCDSGNKIYTLMRVIPTMAGIGVAMHFRKKLDIEYNSINRCHKS